MQITVIRSLTMLLILCQISSAFAARFTSQYPCSDATKTCVSRGMREINGFKVTRDCWEWHYTRSCNYPSKNDCHLYSSCYFVKQTRCLLTDSLGNCVNAEQEFSCQVPEPTTIERQKVRTGLREKEGAAKLVCQGIPCLDGNCVDKSYETNGEMMDAISKLYASSKMNPDKNGNFNLFQGSNQHCSKKPVGYSNCCPVDPKGWGRNLGAKCTKDEQILGEQRAKNLCVYVGKTKSTTLGVETVIKHHFCCFGNMLDKVVQVEGRKQLGMNFGSGGSPNCRGLTLDEIQRIDFSKMDFSEFIEDFKIKFAGRYKAPNQEGLSRTVKGSVDGIRKYDNNPDNKKNNMSGWNEKVQNSE